MEIAKDILKKHLLSILCGCVAILSVILLFFPVQGLMYSSFDDSLSKDQKMFNSIHSLLIEQRKLPKLFLDKELPFPGSFPNERLVKDVEREIASYSANSRTLVQSAESYNHQDRPLIEPAALPAPRHSNAPYGFRDQYLELMTMHPAAKPRSDGSGGKSSLYNLADDLLHAAPPATESEIREARNKLWNDQYQQKIVETGTGSNKPDIDAIFLKKTANFRQTFHRNRARSNRIYMLSDALARVPAITPQSTPNPSEMWFAQMMYWIELDVCKAIGDLNGGAPIGVPHSPVKNLLRLAIKPTTEMYLTPAPAGGAATDASGPNYSRSPTGRVCNPLYDVVEFNLSVVVDARDVDALLSYLRFGKFITVTRMEAQDVDNQAAESLGYVYGSAPCVMLNLDCEELFMRNWTVGTLATDKDTQSSGPMPAEVQKQLGITPPVATPPSQQTGNVAAAQ